MTDTELEQIVFLIVKVAAVVVMVFNAGIGLILLRQIITMNAIINVESKFLMFIITFFFIVIVSLTLLYAIII